METNSFSTKISSNHLKSSLQSKFTKLSSNLKRDGLVHDFPTNIYGLRKVCTKSVEVLLTTRRTLKGATLSRKQTNFLLKYLAITKKFIMV